MNNIAISPYICMYALQIQNVKRNTSKKANIDVLNKKEDIEVPINESTDTQDNENTDDKINFQNKTI